jgi:hypothetical protein
VRSCARTASRATAISSTSAVTATVVGLPRMVDVDDVSVEVPVVDVDASLENVSVLVVRCRTN